MSLWGNKSAAIEFFRILFQCYGVVDSNIGF